MQPTPPPPPPLQPPPSPPFQSFQPPARRFGTGEVLSETFSVFFSSPVPLAITAIVLGPFSLLSLLIVRSVHDPESAQRVEKLLDLVQRLGITPLATAAIVYAVFQRMRGRQVEAGDAIRVGLSKLGRVVGVAILQGLAILVGTLLCVLPGIVFATMLAVAVPVAVEEQEAAGAGVSSALGRSSELTEGHRLSIFFVYLCLLLLGVGAGLFLGLVVGVATLGNDLFIEIVAIPFDIVASGLGATASTVMYYRLRSLKESLDVDQIASVFD